MLPFRGVLRIELVGASTIIVQNEYLAANVFLLFLGILLTLVFVSVLKVKKKYLIPIVLLLSAVGVFALQSSTFDLWVMLGFGVLGYVLRRFDYPIAPIVIGMILGLIAEASYRRSLLISDSGHMIFLERPISATILVACVVLVAAFLPWKRIAGHLAPSEQR